ncbi:MAG TPA: alkaline phosphatase PhoX [Thermomicrobiales bacterium]|nr:alkaline phosphatase PhoX [Thermomicrobiales bacterium]
MAHDEILPVIRFDRRRMLGIASGTVAATMFGPLGLAGAADVSANVLAAYTQSAGFGDLVPDPKGRLALPEGFSYTEISPAGSKLTNGDLVPDWHDGSAAFPGADGNIILIRNHEITYEPKEDPSILRVPASKPYDSEAMGGTTAVVIAPDRTVVESFVASSGTLSNCAGGATPWGTWLTCEEVTSKILLDEDEITTKLPHGYVYEVDPSDPEGELSRTPIKDMGTFSHEAVGFDTETGIIYLTEDGDTDASDTDPSKDTGGSFLYRFTPTDKSQKPGALQKGGKLESLKAVKAPTTNDADLLDQGNTLSVTWVEVDKDDTTADALAKGCLHFNRLEGASFAAGTLWFCDTNGGEQRLGQIFRYTPKTNMLELFYEGTDGAGYPGSDAGTDFARLESPDNITVAPWGDIIVAEDGGGVNRLIGFTPDAESYVMALHNLPYPTLEEEGLPVNFQSEVTGPTFSPDGKTLFFNVQYPGTTFAVWGPFKEPSAERQALMAVAPAPAALAPHVSPELRAAASRHNLTIGQALAFHRLGVLSI